MAGTSAKPVPSADAAEFTHATSCHEKTGAFEVNWFDNVVTSTLLPSLSAQGATVNTLPIFLLVVMFQAKPYQVFVNGVTGEVHGQRPYSWIKITLAVIAALIVVGIGLGIYYSSK